MKFFLKLSIYLALVAFSLSLPSCKYQKSTDLIIGPATYEEQNTQELTGGELRLHFLDVGQADCTLVQFPDGRALLVDAGNTDDFPLIQEYLNKEKIIRLDYLVATHPHEDHIGSLDSVICNFDTGVLYMPNVAADTVAFRDLMKAAAENKVGIVNPRAGLFMLEENNLKVQFLAPGERVYEDPNDYSIVVRVTFGQDSFLLMSDAETQSENDILEMGFSIDSELLRVGHHGFSGSTGVAFLQRVRPDFAVISTGGDPEYGYPSSTTLRRLDESGATIFRTDFSGTVVAVSKGNGISIITSQ